MITKASVQMNMGNKIAAAAMVAVMTFAPMASFAVDMVSH
jgi:hypothetical protein